MQALGLLGSAFVGILHPASILMMIAGVAIGIIFGSIPGLSASMAVALMLPLTFSMTPSMGLNTLVAVYIGGISGVERSHQQQILRKVCRPARQRRPLFFAKDDRSLVKLRWIPGRSNEYLEQGHFGILECSKRH